MSIQPEVVGLNEGISLWRSKCRSLWLCSCARHFASPTHQLNAVKWTRGQRSKCRSRWLVLVHASPICAHTPTLVILGVTMKEICSTQVFFNAVKCTRGERSKCRSRWLGYGSWHFTSPICAHTPTLATLGILQWRRYAPDTFCF